MCLLLVRLGWPQHVLHHYEYRIGWHKEKRGGVRGMIKDSTEAPQILLVYSSTDSLPPLNLGLVCDSFQWTASQFKAALVARGYFNTTKIEDTHGGIALYLSGGKVVGRVDKRKSDRASRISCPTDQFSWWSVSNYGPGWYGQRVSWEGPGPFAMP